MRLLWLSNLAPGPVRQALTGEKGSGLWMEHVLEDLPRVADVQLMMVCPWEGEESGNLSSRWSYQTFRRQRPEELYDLQKQMFRRILRDFQPDVIHIWGTEFSHSLAMVLAAEELHMLDRVVIGIQGLCLCVGRHYLEGLPIRVQLRFTFRDFLRQDNLVQQKTTFLRRGKNEVTALQKVSHVIGRTHWDRACVRQIHSAAQYHFCNETLRKSFYEGCWSYENCVRHRIFASSCLYPIKGFHYALEAFAQILKEYPDAVLAVPGANPQCRWRGLLRQDSYARHLKEMMDLYSLEGHVEYLGSLSEEEMKAEYLKANAFIMPSSIENSSNSLGEAMLLGVPCAAADVGGTSTLMQDGEGILYQGTAPYMLADAVCRIFAMGAQAETMGAAARAHARKTHDPEVNFYTLMKIYQQIAEQKGKSV